MNALFKLINDRPAYAASFVGIGLVAAAYVSQYIFGLAPCELCWWQRYPYLIILGLLPVMHVAGYGNSRLFLGLVLVLFAVDAGIAGFHTGVEQKWWEGLATCSGMADLSGSVDDALAAIMGAPVIKCDEIPWSLFGISMAGYNFLIASIMTVFCAKKLMRKQP